MHEQVKRQALAAVFTGLVVAAAVAGGISLVLGGTLAGVMVAGLLGALVAGVVTYLMVVAPLVEGMGHVVRLVTSPGDEALERERPQTGLAAALTGQVGGFIARHGRLVSDLAGIGGGMATAAAEVSFASDQLRARVHEQVGHVNEIVNAAENISQTVQAAVAQSAEAVETAKATRRASYIGQETIQEATEKMGQMRARVEEAASLMTNLESRADQIKQITGVINEIADQTNLLALNAAIEAARAGDQGRGFAVVAEEVRNLAKRTTAATTEIGQMVGEINEETGHAVSTMHSLVEAVAQSGEQTTKVDRQFEEVLEHARGVENQILTISQGSEENHAHLENISASIQSVSSHLTDTERQVESVSHQALQLSDRAEGLFESLGDLDLGTVHDQVRQAAVEAAAQIGGIFEQAAAGGRLSLDDLFDRNYRPIDGTDPQKHHTRFDSFTDEVLPPLQEAIVAEIPAVAFAVAVDNNGYLPTHNRKFSQPLTGDYQKDLINNRTKRIFDDRTGSRCGSNTKPFLLQTYKRDTGEVMHDLSVPIYVNGRHWGGFRIGYRSD